MPAVTVLGMIDTGHASFPPTPSTSASGDVFVGSIGVVRVGDSYASHGSPTPSPVHGRALASGSSTVFINGLPAGRIGDPIDCGGVVAEGNPTVFIGG